MRGSTHFIKKNLKGELVGVEIGVWEGKNALSILKHLPIKKLYLIDPYSYYKGYEDEDAEGIHYIDLEYEEWEKIFKSAKELLSEYKDKIVWIRKKASDAIKDIPNDLDFVYIDGNHNYEYVKQDIENYFPKLKKEGILAGHDLHYKSVRQAIKEFAGKNKLNLYPLGVADWIVDKKFKTKPKINLRLCVAGEESLLPLFENCLISYLKFFEIEKLLVYTTSNLQEKIENFIVGLDLPTINDAEIHDIDKFYEKNYDKFPQSVKEVLDYSKNVKFKKIHNMFYMRIRLVMDYYLVNKPFILSDLDIEIFDNIKPILDWIDSDYILYNADYLNDYYSHNQGIVKNVGADFFKPIPQFNPGWMCVPKGIKINIEEVYKIMKQDMDSGPVEMTAMAIVLIRDKIKTKILPRELMVTKQTKKSELENKTLAHFGPYGLKEFEAKAKQEKKMIVPKSVFVFDINNTLDIMGIDRKEVNFLLNTKEVFSKLKKSGHWVGLTSGMNEWMCLQLVNMRGIQVDFVYGKERLRILRDSLESYFNIKPKK